MNKLPFIGISLLIIVIILILLYVQYNIIQNKSSRKTKKKKHDVSSEFEDDILISQDYIKKNQDDVSNS